MSLRPEQALQLLAVVLHKYRFDLPVQVLITAQDLVDFKTAYPDGDAGVVLHDSGGQGAWLRVMTLTDAEKLRHTQAKSVTAPKRAAVTVHRRRKAR